MLVPATSISKHIKKWKKCLGSQRRFCGICYFSSTLPKKTPFNLLATDQNSEALTREVASFLGSSHFIGSPVSCHLLSQKILAIGSPQRSPVLDEVCPRPSETIGDAMP